MDLPLPFIIAIGLAAGIWALLFALRLPTLHACLAFLLTVACFGVAFAKWEIGSFTASADRLLLVLLVALTGLKRLMTPQPRLQFDRYDLLLAGMMLLLAVSVWTHAAPPRRSPTSPTPSYLFIASYLFPALLYWIVRYRMPTPRDTRFVQGFFLIFGVYLAFTAICEVHGPSALVFPSYILKTRTLYAGRAVGPFMSAPALGTWLTVAAVCGMLIWSRAHGAGKLMVMLLFPLFAYAQYLTQTRSAWMGFVAAVPLAGLLSVGRELKHFLVVGIGIAALVAGLFVGEKFLWPERAEGRGVVAQSTGQRLALMQISLALFVQRPLTGWGFGQFEHVSDLHGGGGPLQWVPSEDARGLASHNVFLRFLAETGVLGAAILVALFVTWLTLTRRILRGFEPQSQQRQTAILFLGAFVAYVSEAMFHDVTFISQDNILLFFLAGCLCSYQPTSSTKLPETAQSFAAHLRPQPPLGIPSPGWSVARG